MLEIIQCFQFLWVKSKVLSMVHKPFLVLQAPHLPEFDHYAAAILLCFLFCEQTTCTLTSGSLHLLLLLSGWFFLQTASLFSSQSPQVYTQMFLYQRGFSSSIKINPSHIVLLFLAPNIIWPIIHFIYLLIVSVFISRIQGSRNLVLLMPRAWHSTIFASRMKVKRRMRECKEADTWMPMNGRHLLLENVSFTVGSSVFTSQLSEEDSKWVWGFCKRGTWHHFPGCIFAEIENSEERSYLESPDTIEHGNRGRAWAPGRRRWRVTSCLPSQVETMKAARLRPYWKSSTRVPSRVYQFSRAAISKYHGLGVLTYTDLLS